MSEAITDVLRLSRAMSYKNALAQLSTGGGKSVIIGDPANDKSAALFHAFGRFVESLQGRYIVAEDVGTTVDDMNHIKSQTSHVMGFSAQEGSSGDSSPVTAYGVFAASKQRSNTASAAMT
jgi:leucine dehydrogenase